MIGCHNALDVYITGRMDIGVLSLRREILICTSGVWAHARKQARFTKLGWVGCYFLVYPL